MSYMRRGFNDADALTASRRLYNYHVKSAADMESMQVRSLAACAILFTYSIIFRLSLLQTSMTDRLSIPLTCTMEELCRNPGYAMLKQQLMYMHTAAARSVLPQLHHPPE